MNCLPDNKIQEMVEENISADNYVDEYLHMKKCNTCKNKFNQYKILEEKLHEHVMIEPPESIRKFVMDRILVKSPSLQSVMFSIFFSISFIVFIALAYYGFSKEGLLKGAELMGSILFNFVHSVIVLLSNILDYVLIIAKSLNKFTSILFGFGADMELIGLTFIVLFTVIFFTLYKLSSKISVYKRAQGL
jgi:hypothetical protein